MSSKNGYTTVELGAHGVYFSRWTNKDKFASMIRDLLPSKEQMPEGYWNGYQWEDDDSYICFWYEDGTYIDIRSGEKVPCLRFEKIVAGLYSNCSGYDYYDQHGDTFEIVYDEEIEAYWLRDLK